MRYRFTAARRRALRKAQLISARKRKKFTFQATKKVVRKNHKAIIGVVAAGAGIATAAYHTNAWMNKEKRNALEGALKRHRENLMRNQLNAMPGPDNPAASSNGGMLYPNLVSSGYKNADYIVRIQNRSPQIVKNVLAELRGTEVPLRKGTERPKRNGKPVKRKYRIQYGDYVPGRLGDYGEQLYDWVPTTKPLK